MQESCTTSHHLALYILLSEYIPLVSDYEMMAYAVAAYHATVLVCIALKYKLHYLHIPESDNR